MRRMHTALLMMLPVFSTVGAQQLHQGFWIGLAPGGVGIADKEGLSYPLYLRLGGTINQQWLVGLEWYGVILDAEPSADATNLTAVALFYPSPGRGSFAKAGIGRGRASSICPSTSSEDVASGIGVTLGVGTDIRMGKNIYLTPNVDVMWQQAERRLCPVPGNPLAATVQGYSPGFFFTLGVTWH